MTPYEKHIRWPQFYTPTGWLTPYGLACGYIESWKNKSGAIHLTLSHDGGNVYHVKAYDSESHDRLFWDVFESLSAARGRFTRAKREIETDG